MGPHFDQFPCHIQKPPLILERLYQFLSGDTEGMLLEWTDSLNWWNTKYMIWCLRPFLDQFMTPEVSVKEQIGSQENY